MTVDVLPLMHLFISSINKQLTFIYSLQNAVNVVQCISMQHLKDTAPEEAEQLPTYCDELFKGSCCFAINGILLMEAILP